MIFNIKQNPYGDNNRLYSFDNIFIEEGITVLCGPNGSGKTTLMHIIKDEVQKQQDCACFDYASEASIVKRNIGLEIDYVLREITSSGEYGYIVTKKAINERVKNLFLSEEHKNLFFLFDSMDDCASIDRIIEIKDLFKEIIKAGERYHKHVYVICSTNNFELAQGYRCINVRDGNNISFETYEQYKEYIMNERNEKQ